MCTKLTVSIADTSGGGVNALSVSLVKSLISPQSEQMKSGMRALTRVYTASDLRCSSVPANPPQISVRWCVSAMPC